MQSSTSASASVSKPASVSTSAQRPPGYGKVGIRSRIVVALIFVFTLLLIPAQLFILKYALRHWSKIPVFYHRTALKLMGVRVRLVGAPLRAPSTLYVGNHVSWLDIPVMGAQLPVSFIAKREVGDWGPFGTLARLQRTIFVDRERRGEAHEQTNEIAARLAQGDSLVLFAEGTSTDGAIVLPFKSALLAVAEPATSGREMLMVQPFTIAYRAVNGVPLSRGLRPLVGWYGDMELEPHFLALLGLGRIDVDVIFHEPVKSSDFSSRKTLAAHCHAQVRAGLMASRRGVRQ
jgi:1-acyl-sn-glycerol-3-phosphate acyltransferase